MTFFIALCPIILLIFLMIKRKNLPASQALPLVAGLSWLLSLVYFAHPANEVNAAVLDGLLTAATPLLIIYGAIVLFRSMESTGSMDVLRSWLNGVSSNKVAQLMIVGWTFEFLIEGASGFGTPAALAAPILVGLGFPPLSTAAFTLVMDTIPVSFGAVGTPTWFGFSEIISLSSSELLLIGWKTALMHSVAALLIPPLALLLLVKPKKLIKNLPFVYLSIAATLIPHTLIARFNYEFPSLIGGLIGLLVTVFLASRGIGLEKQAKPSLQELATKTKGEAHFTPDFSDSAPFPRLEGRKIMKALFPIWGSVLLLIITRIPAFGIKSLLSATEPSAHFSLGNLGIFSVSPALVLGLKNIFNTRAGWSISLLYVPGIIPFLLLSLLNFILHKSKIAKIRACYLEAARQMAGPIRALLGALVLVNLLMLGGPQAPTMIIGKTLARYLGSSWLFFASFLGALGSFFSGSNTISNLSFGAIQDSIAGELGLSRSTVLAAQSAGGALGNMICIHNIVAVCTVLSLKKSEGAVLKKTTLFFFPYAILVGVLALLL